MKTPLGKKEKDRSEPKARLEARISTEQKQLLTRAAEIAGCSLTEFLVSSAREAAYRIIREHQVLTMSQKDQETFVASLLEDAEPSERLEQAAKRYQRDEA